MAYLDALKMEMSQSVLQVPVFILMSYQDLTRYLPQTHNLSHAPGFWCQAPMFMCNTCRGV